ncbi:MAG: hypothetical protein IT282_14820 [Bacteroidetes bacterium]|nr:hypothetical protein [Bacteroidota bacterium]
MPIQEIITSSGSVDPVKGNKSQPAQKSPGREKVAKDSEEKADRVEVSDEARALYEAEQSGRFEAIREKIRKGFYFQREVTEKVVDAMLKDVKQQPPEK